MRGWTLARRLRFALGALSLLLLLAGAALVGALHQVDRVLTDQTLQVYPARLAAGQLLTSLVDQETGLRGYALSRDDRFLEPYRQGLVDEQEHRAELEQYVRPDDPARLDLLTLDAAITAWRDQYASLRSGALSGDGPDSTIDFGRELFDRVRSTSAALDDRLAAQVRAAQDEAARDRRVVLLVLTIMALSVLVAVVLLQRALQASVLRPMRRLGEQVAVVAAGGHGTAIQPYGPPDLQEVAGGVESMRQELVNVLAEVEEQQRGLERRATELARSNADLEQFAYVASHDLQEPLRKVASFCQLLEQRYAGQLDERGEQYIAFAVDGAKRMQRLISDLLTFSRVGRSSERFVPVDLADAVATAWSGLDARVLETGAELELDLTDRHVVGDQALLQLLLANLLGNAVKYRSPDRPPRVRVSAAQETGPGGAMVRVRVADNGIGIAPEYEGKVFVIFQRLHGRDEYEGTGIGLALAKKVVEFHGGEIGLEPSPLDGACVWFTLPVAEDVRG